MTTIRFYKPYNVLTKFTDAEGRPTLADFIDLPNIYPAGRLDMDSEGLLILTDYKPLATRLTDPAYAHPRTYHVQVENIPDEQALQKLESSIMLKDYTTLPAKAKLLSPEPAYPERIPPIRQRKTIPTAWIELTLIEGKNRQVRHMTAAVGHPTLRLIRVAIGQILLEGLQPGEWQVISPQSIKKIMNSFKK